MENVTHPMMKDIRPGAEKTAVCPGCADGIIAHSALRAVDELGMDMDSFVFVSGIGCAGWIPSPYFNADTLHTPHGRPIAFATGVKLAKPKTNVIVFSGDGDLGAIGGNHFITCGEKKHWFDCVMRQQWHLRHDGRPGGAHNTTRRENDHNAL